MQLIERFIPFSARFTINNFVKSKTFNEFFKDWQSIDTCRNHFIPIWYSNDPYKSQVTLFHILNYKKA